MGAPRKAKGGRKAPAVPADDLTGAARRAEAPCEGPCGCCPDRRAAAREAANEREAERWARRYDALNGAPDSEEDR